MVCFVVLAVAPAVKQVADGAGGTVSLQSAWPLRVLQATLLVGYATAGLCKVFHGNWLGDADILWTQVQGSYRTETAAWLLQFLAFYLLFLDAGQLHALRAWLGQSLRLAGGMLAFRGAGREV